MYFDSHAHLASDPILSDVDAILSRAKEAGVERIINICTDAESFQKGLELEKTYPFIKNTAAITPHDANKGDEEYFAEIKRCAHQKELVAIGETGLDYHHFDGTKEEQKKWLIRHLQLALECSLPVVIHCRDAFKDFFEIIDSEYRDEPGVLHCFTGTLKEAKQVIERGWYLSLSGIATFKRSDELRQVAKEIPIEQLLIETDAPYLAPQGKRGKMNEPSFLPITAACIAACQGVSPEALAKATSDNAERLFLRLF